MILLRTNTTYLSERPQNIASIEITNNIRLWLDQPLDNFSVSFYEGMGKPDQNFEYTQIDHVNPVITSNTFTINLNDAEFTFVSTRNFFTLREICECLLVAWKTPLNEIQLSEMSKTFDLECFMPDGVRSVMTLDSIFPTPNLNGLCWNNGRFFASEMQD